ncbi:hypothetical protein E3N88_18324 [Mikania micrantha]|uniref:Uncharacterized protein n=1 Tax=Mikania micrantha TaxID=192012 RepID=A0A5N6NX36_9ASTR|nr:hypothetical protein E3N88_18324 [Mikania micrantha]
MLKLSDIVRQTDWPPRLDIGQALLVISALRCQNHVRQTDWPTRLDSGQAILVIQYSSVKHRCRKSYLVPLWMDAEFLRVTYRNKLRLRNAYYDAQANTLKQAYTNLVSKKEPHGNNRIRIEGI